MHGSSSIGWAELALPIGVALGLVAGLVLLFRLSRRAKKLLLKRHLRHAWRWLEEKGVVEKTPPLIHDYHRLYPELALLERHFEVIQKECRELMAASERIPHIQQSGGQYTTGGIHQVER